MARFKQLAVGSRHGRFVVQRAGEPVESKKAGGVHRDSTSVCLCDCGATKTVLNVQLRGGYVLSCGCLKTETSRSKAKHGYNRQGSRSPEYNAWCNMRSRVGNPKNNKHEHYGGRGIKVCDRWLESFENFIADMGDKPTPQHSLDRIDNDGDYCPENCQWATKKQQLRNTRRCHLVTCNGVTRTLAEWEEITGIQRRTIHYRLKAGWPVEEALSSKQGS